MTAARVGASQPMASCLGPSYNSPPQPCSSYDVAQFLLRQRSRTPGVFKGPWNWNRTRRSCRGKSHAIAAEEHHDVDPAVGEKSALLCSCCACIPPPLALSSAGSLSRSLAGEKKGIVNKKLVERKDYFVGKHHITSHLYGLVKDPHSYPQRWLQLVPKKRLNRSIRHQTSDPKKQDLLTAANTTDSQDQKYGFL